MAIRWRKHDFAGDPIARRSRHSTRGVGVCHAPTRVGHANILLLLACEVKLIDRLEFLSFG